MKDRFKTSSKSSSAARLTPWSKYQAQRQHQRAKRGRLRDLKSAARNKRHRQFLINLILISVEMILVILIGLYLISPLNRISGSKITGSQTISSQRFDRDLRIHRGDSLVHWLINFDKHRRLTMKHNPQLKSVHFSLHRWNRITIRATEYQKVAYLKRQNRYYAVTNNNHQIGNRVYHFSNSASVPVLFHFKAGSRLGWLIDQYQKIPTGIRNDVSEIDYEPTSVDPERVRLFMNDGNQVLIRINDLKSKLRYYPSISKSMNKNGVVNLEVGAYSYPFNHK